MDDLKTNVLSEIIEFQQEIVTSDLNLNALKVLICKKAQAITKAAGAVVEIAEGDFMVYRAASGTLEPFQGVKLNLHTSLSGRSVLTNQILYCTDSEIDDRVDRDACRKVKARSMICVPLIHNKKAIGVLKVVSERIDDFSEDKIRILRLIAGLLSATIAIRQSEANALEATRTKTQFLANMSHEIRTPINGILGMTQLLAYTKLESEQQEYVNTIDESAKALLSLVNEILDISKIEAGKLSIDVIPFELRNLIKGIVGIAEPMANAKGLSLEIVIDDSIPHKIMGDPLRIRQVLLNLVNNAIKFSHAGRVKLNIKNVGGDDNKVSLFFEVIDSGIGFTEEIKKKLFQNFVQADITTTRNFGGTGLGLSITRQLVEMMGGTVDCESKPNAGSRFFFNLDLDIYHSVTEVPVKTENATAGPVKFDARVLVAEDNLANQKVITGLLKVLGCTVTMVNNGCEAIDALKKDTFDMLITDEQMPEMDGFEATIRIRKGEAGEHYKRLPILACTASAFKSSLEKCVAIGMSDFITKPVTIEHIIERFNKWLKLGFRSVDVGVLQKLAPLEKQNPGFINGFIDIFNSSSQEEMQMLKAALNLRDIVALKSSAHRFKSTCMNVGAVRMVDICALLETTADLREFETIKRLVGQLEWELAHVTRELHDY